MYSGDIREPTWGNASTLAWNARDVGSIPALSTIFPIFITPTTYIYVHMIYIYIYIYTCVYVCTFVGTIVGNFLCNSFMGNIEGNSSLSNTW